MNLHKCALFLLIAMAARAQTTAGSLVATPPSLAFTYQQGSPAPQKQVVIVSSTNGMQLPFSVTASGGSWLLAGVDSGTSPAPFNVNVLPIGLDAGIYSGAFTISSPGLQPVLVKISLTVTVQAPPQLSVGPLSVNLTGVQGGSPSSAQVVVANAGGGVLAFTATTAIFSGGAWLSVSPASGTVDNSASGSASPVSMTVTGDPGSLLPGTYQAAVTIQGAGTTAVVPVTFSVTGLKPVILVSQTGLSFTAVSFAGQAAGGAPLPQQLGILNIGSGVLDWNAALSTVTGGSWLLLSPPRGTVQRPYLDVSLADVGIDPAVVSTLSPGEYYGQIRIAGPALNSPQLVTVILTVLPAGSDPGPEVRPASLIFTGLAGVSPAPQSVTIGIRKTQGDKYLSAHIGGGFSYSPATSTVQPNVPASLQVTPDFSALSPGEIDRGTITLQFSDGTVRNIGLLTVVAPGAVGNSVAKPLASDSCQNLNVQWRTPSPPSFSVLQGRAQTLEVQVVDSCGNLVGPGDPRNAGVQATFSNKDADLKLVHLRDGIWTGTWKPVSALSSVLVVVTAFNSSGLGLQSGQSTTLVGSVVVGNAQGVTGMDGMTPTVDSRGVLNSASFIVGAPIAPGLLITLKGANLADADSSTYSIVPLPTLWNGTQVFLGTQPLPLRYASPTQVDAQVPYDVPLNTYFQLTIQRDNVLSVPETVVVAAAQPGVLTVNNLGKGPGVIFHADGVERVLAQPTSCESGQYTCSPAKAGETLVIYCTGLGAVSPAIRAGILPPYPPISSTVNAVNVTIGGQDAWVVESTLVASYPGVYQIAVMVPDGVSGDTVPVAVTAAGQTSPPVSFS